MFLKEYQGLNSENFKNTINNNPRLRFWVGLNFLCWKSVNHSTIIFLYVDKLFLSLNSKTDQSRHRTLAIETPIHSKVGISWAVE